MSILLCSRYGNFCFKVRGVGFSNQVWTDVRIPRQHHAEVDFQNVADMGFNSVRFSLNYKTLEDDAAPGETLADGWQWLDDNILWASAHNVQLVLNLQVPPGGSQSPDESSALWTDPALQQRFINLWRTIAERYRGVPALAGFGLLHEPAVPAIDDWKRLAERTIAAIRQVNPDHIIFLERLTSVDADPRENETRNFNRVADPNVVYEFHFYKPWHFTHQGSPSAETAALDQRYPDELRAEVESCFLEWRLGTFDSPKLPPGNSNWRYYRGAPFRVTDPSYQVAKPALVCDQVGAGKASFDDLVLEKLHGGRTEQIWKQSLNTRRGWTFWSQDQSGEADVDHKGHKDDAALSVTGTSSIANLGADYLRVPVEQGATYRLSGWMRGQAIPRGATCQIRLDFLSSSVKVARRNKDFLAQGLDAYLSWGRAQNVPVYLGEFGTIRASYEEDRGGLRWTGDMLDLVLERNLSFSFHAYHDDQMGIYYGDDTLPDPGNANTALVSLLRQKLAAPLALPASIGSPADR